MYVISGGETEIRTQERVAPLPVFKTGAFNRSAISPYVRFYKYSFKIQLKKAYQFFFYIGCLFYVCYLSWLRLLTDLNR